MTLDQWKGREDLQLRVDATLNEPHMVDLVATLISMGLPQGTHLPDINLNALRNSYNEGYFKALANLELLRAIKPMSNQPLPPPWEKLQSVKK